MNGLVAERMNIPIDLIKPSPYQPRLSFDLDNIKASIRRDGILVALTVRKKAGVYELVDGERRWRVARQLGIATVACNVITIDDDTARQMVWKVNTVRRDYEPREKALFFRRMREESRMSLTGIAREFGMNHRDVKAYLNIFKMPEEYQQMVWDRIIPIRNIRELDQLFDRVTTATPEESPEIFEILDRSVKERHFGAEQIREVLKPHLADLREVRIERAQEALAKIKPEAKVPETPEELKKAANILRREAGRRKTSEQKLKDERIKATRARDSIIRLLDKSRELMSVSKYHTQIEDLETVIEEEPTKAISELRSLRKQLHSDFESARQENNRQRLEREIRESIEKRLETERRRIEEVAKTKAKEELMKDEEFLERVVETTAQKRVIQDWRGTEVPARGPEKEIVTEDVWECPICHARHHLIHLEPSGHRLEEIKGD